MLCPPFISPQVVQNWLARHRDPRSFALHMIGIPPTVIAVLILPVAMPLQSRPIFLFSVALFVGGYLIQFLGHALDGTEPGEVTALRRRLGRSLMRVTPPAEPRGRMAKASH